MANLSNINNKFLFTDGDFLKIGNSAPINNISGTESGISITNGNCASITLDNSAAQGKTFSIYSAVNGSLNFYDVDANSGRLIIDSSGNVGIGTVLPSANLNVVGPGDANDPVVAIDVTNSSAFNHGLEIFDANLTDGETVLMAIGKAGSTKNTAIFGYIHDADGGNDNLATIGFWGADNKMTVSAGGNVGIGTGTATPGYKLQVQGTGYYSGQLTVDGFTNDSGISFRTGIAITNVGIRAKAVGTTNRDGLELLGYNGIDFTVNNGANVAMRIVGVTGSGMGNVGIGTTSPSAPLDVWGSGADGTALLRLTGSGGSTNFNWISSVVYPNLASGNTAIKLFGHSQGTNNQAYVGFKYAGSGSASNTLTFGFYANNFLVNLLANGNLGIGTDGPSSKLTVYGGGSTTSTLELRGGASGADNATISTQQSMAFQIGSAGATGRSYTFLSGGLGYGSGTALFSIDSNGGTFNRSWPQTTTSGSSSVVQTTLIPEPGVYEFYLRGNPNAGGSGAYTSLQAGLITIAVDYTPAKSVFLRITKHVTAQDGGGSSNIQLNLNVYMLYNGSASGEQSIANKDQSVIYLTVSGYVGTVGSSQILRLTRKI